MPKVDLSAIPQTNATGYPAPFDAPVKDRWYRRLAPSSGLTYLAASHVVLKPGAWSSQRHWHDDEDELLVIISGEAVLVDDDGETLLRPGDIAAFPAADGNGHHLRNMTNRDCVFVVVGAGEKLSGGAYADIDMIFDENGYYRKDGTPYGSERTR